MTTITDILARWAALVGRPYKGKLIDLDAYKNDPDDIGCMCAQGQLLHQLGGWSADELRASAHRDADAATAKLLNISCAHAILLRQINDRVDGAPGIVLTDPGQILGNQWSKLLDFWSHIDGLDHAGWMRVAAAWTAARTAAGAVAWTTARDAAGDAAWDAAGGAALTAVGAVAWDAARFAAGEIQGASVFERDERPFFFLPMFGFATPADIPSRPANYGVVA